MADEATGLGLGGKLALGLGAADLVGGLLGQRSARREQDRQRDFWQSQLKKRRSGAIGQALQGIFQEQMKGLEDLPGYLKREREGRLASAASERMSRFQRNLARSGATRASTAGMMGERGIADDIERMNQQGMLGEQQAMMSARGQVGGMGNALMNALYGSPGQALQGMGQNMQSFVYNPMSAFKSGALGGLMGQEYATLSAKENALKELTG